ncbi:acetolactate synthase catalytic subunit [Azospirillum sp. YIM B02556]|uniref:Acetolactate synthase catalytic subunit n=1 Tax=Azospirillum endophyticum TaxID=2800326 RepID=A0ABS1F4T7_9PROT|nr:acetolactate synthase catalytic subunit [Azospirillum endophyticum]MBK1838422.1 acetolactate synthase catalytic subunit [Azospirillum endophyticum]
MDTHLAAAKPVEGSNRTGAHVFAAALKRHGVEMIFGQSIPSALFLVAPEFGIRQIGYRTENAGTAMADAYARVSHKVPVVTAQNGPAATLLVAGLAEALKASVPIVAIVQDVHRKQTDKNAFQELDHLELFRGCAKWIKRVSEVERIDDYVDMAFTAAASGRPGPAVLIAPIDLFNDVPAPGTGERVASLGRFPLDRVAADPARVREAAALLAAAKAPLVIAGGGIHLSDAAAELAALQDRASLPVATTAMGKGAVDERHPLSLGPVGYFMGTGGRTRHLRPMVEDADVILLIGNRTNQNGTDSWSLYPKTARFIHLDVDGQEIGRNYEALRLVGDAKLTLAALAEALEGEDLSARHAARPKVEKQIAAGLAAWKDDVARAIPMDAAPVRPERLMRDLDSVLTPETIVVADASYSSIWVANYLTSRKPGMRFVTPRGLAGLGWGLPFALGAKCARPDAPVFALVGDGGFAHVWSELETARRMGLNVVVAVLNNQILGYQKHAEKVLFNDYSDVCDFAAVDHAAIARACGCAGERIETPDAFLPALQRALAAGTTTVLDIVTEQRAHPPVTMFEGNARLNY